MADKDARDRSTVAPLVTGQVVITARTPAVDGAALHIRLEDVSKADAAAVVVAETAIADVRHPFSNGGSAIPFELHALPGAAAIDPRHDYTVRAWLDCDGDGKPGAGDLYSDQSYPVLTRGFGRAVTITLEQA